MFDICDQCFILIGKCCVIFSFFFKNYLCSVVIYSCSISRCGIQTDSDNKDPSTLMTSWYAVETTKKRWNSCKSWAYLKRLAIVDSRITVAAQDGELSGRQRKVLVIFFAATTSCYYY